MRVKEFFQDLEKREYALIIFTGLVVSWVRHGLQYHWKAWPSWEDFFLSWFVHTIGVVLLMGVALAAIIYSHKFFLGSDSKDNGREMTFYILMTILVASLGIAFLALRGPAGDDYDDSSAYTVYAV